MNNLILILSYLISFNNLALSKIYQGILTYFIVLTKLETRVYTSLVSSHVCHNHVTSHVIYDDRPL